jgi:hypothetical protein
VSRFIRFLPYSITIQPLWGRWGEGPIPLHLQLYIIVAQGWLQHMSAENFIYLEHFIQKNENSKTFQNILDFPSQKFGL